MQASRIGISFIPGAVITFLLLVLMFTLIYTATVSIDEEPARRIADIHQPERQVEERVERQEVERPDDPEPPPPDMPQVQERFDIPDGAVSMAAPQVGTDLAAGLGGFARDSDYVPIVFHQPTYPNRALSRGIEGYAVVEFTIGRDGRPLEHTIRVLEEHPAATWGFGRAAEQAARRLRYNPRIVDGEPQEAPGVTYLFRFRIEG